MKTRAFSPGTRPPAHVARDDHAPLPTDRTQGRVASRVVAASPCAAPAGLVRSSVTAINTPSPQTGAGAGRPFRKHRISIVPHGSPRVGPRRDPGAPDFATPRSDKARREAGPCRGSPVEAGGIEPPSRDNRDGGLYMLSPRFDLGRGGGHGQSSPRPSPLCFAPPPRATRRGYPAVFDRRVAGLSAVPRLPKCLGGHCVTVIAVGNYGVSQLINEAY